MPGWDPLIRILYFLQVVRGAAARAALPWGNSYLYKKIAVAA